MSTTGSKMRQIEKKKLVTVQSWTLKDSIKSQHKQKKLALIMRGKL